MDKENTFQINVRKSSNWFKHFIIYTSILSQTLKKESIVVNKSLEGKRGW